LLHGTFLFRSQGPAESEFVERPAIKLLSEGRRRPTLAQLLAGHRVHLAPEPTAILMPLQTLEEVLAALERWIARHDGCLKLAGVLLKEIVLLLEELRLVLDVLAGLHLPELPEDRHQFAHLSRERTRLRLRRRTS
jgi:hypothetical protein